MRIDFSFTHMNRRSALLGAVTAALAAKDLTAQTSSDGKALKRLPGAKPRNVIFILTDDHRYDAMGFMQGQKWLRTPVLDSRARRRPLQERLRDHGAVLAEPSLHSHRRLCPSPQDR